MAAKTIPPLGSHAGGHPPAAIAGWRLEFRVVAGACFLATSKSWKAARRALHAARARGYQNAAIEHRQVAP